MNFFYKKVFIYYLCKFLSNFNRFCYFENSIDNNIVKENNGGLIKDRIERKFLKDGNYKIK